MFLKNMIYLPTTCLLLTIKDDTFFEWLVYLPISYNIIMPNYSYRCSVCDSSFELFAYIKDYVPNPICQCGSPNTYRDYMEDFGTITGSVKKSDSELKTVGDLANRNRDRLSDDEKLSLSKKHNEYKEEVSTKILPNGMSRIVKPNLKTKWT